MHRFCSARIAALASIAIVLGVTAVRPDTIVTDTLESREGNPYLSERSQWRFTGAKYLMIDYPGGMVPAKVFGTDTGLPKPEELRARGGAWFQLPNLQMHVGVDPEPSPRSKRHVCFLVPDLARARAAVVGKGIAIEEESVAEGLSRFFIRDPADNRIEIGQR